MTQNTLNHSIVIATVFLLYEACHVLCMTVATPVG